MKKIALIALSVAFVVGSAGGALAGERTGQGKATHSPGNARSLCAFSGLEDNDFEADVVPGVTQNWGQIIKEAGPLGGAASVPFAEEGCNAHLYPAK